MKPPLETNVVLVGFSSPVYYQYNEEKYSPFGARYNPVLPNPTALATLFDEIWFIHKGLCPIDMRELEFVRFLNEEDWAHAPIRCAKEELNPQLELLRDIERTERTRRNLPRPETLFPEWRSIEGSAYDNHGSQLVLSGFTATGNSVSDVNFCLDTLIEDALMVAGFRNIRLVTHPYSEQFFPTTQLPKALQLDLTHEIIVSRVPNWQSDYGPNHPVIEDLRIANPIAEYRDMVRSMSLHHHAGSQKEIVKIQTAIENEVFKQQLSSNKTPPVYVDSFLSFSAVMIGVAGALNIITAETAALMGGLIAFPPLVRMQKRQSDREKWRAVSCLKNVELVGDKAKRLQSVPPPEPNIRNSLLEADTNTELDLAKRTVLNYYKYPGSFLCWGINSRDRKWQILGGSEVIAEFETEEKILQLARSIEP